MDGLGMEKSPVMSDEQAQAIQADPLGAGMEPGAKLTGAVLITTWEQPNGAGRVSVQPWKVLMDREYFCYTLDTVLASAALGLDPE